LNGGEKCLDVHAPDIGTNGGKVQIWRCSGAQNQNWGTEQLFTSFPSNADAIRAYLDGLPRLPTVQPRAGILGPVPDLPEGISGQQRTGGSFVNDEAELAILKSVPDIVWPGALVQGATIANNQFAPIFLDRPPGRVRLSTEFVGTSQVSKYRDLPVVRAGEVDDARTAMLREINATDATGVQMMELTSAGTIHEAMVKLGITYK